MRAAEERFVAKDACNPPRKPLHNVLVTPPNFDAEAIAFLREHGCAITQPDKPEGALSETEFAALLQTAQGWIIGPQAHVTRALIAASPSCLV